MAAAQQSSHGAVARNTLWNVAGYILPLGVAFIALPPTVRHLGPERYGLFVLVMLVHDYLGYFDFGLGRAATRFLAETVADPARIRSARGVLATCVLFHLALGVLVGALFSALVPWIGPLVLSGAPALVTEGEHTMYAAALFGPVLLLMIATRGALEAIHRFDIVNKIKVPANALTYLIPLVGAAEGWSLPVIVLGLVAMRLVTAVIYLQACWRSLPDGDPVRFQRELAGPLFSFGGQIMAASLAGMLLVDGDRALVSRFAGAAALTYYSVPQDVVTRLWILPASVASALFPIFAIRSDDGAQRAGRIYADSAIYSLLLLIPPVAAIIAGGDLFLRLWMGPTFALEATAVLRFVAVGVLFDSVARVPLTYLQASGSPEVVARVRWWLTPAFLLASAWSITTHGILGAAVVWASRIAVETVLLFGLAARSPALRIAAGDRRRALAATVAGGIVLLVTTAITFLTPDHLAVRLGAAALLLAGFVLFAWRGVVTPEHRRKALGLLQRPRPA